MDLWNTVLSMQEWGELIHRAELGEVAEPLVNVDPDNSAPFDAIFIGGGAGGRFGSAYLKARGGRQLVVDKWPFLGGSCPHQACVPHHLFSEAAREMDYMRWNSGTLWFPEFDEKRASILDVVELFKAGRNNPHAFMNWQSKEQLGMEYILNAKARVIDANTVEVAARRYTTRNLVLGTGARGHLPDIPGITTRGVYDFATLIEELDYEPSRCVIVGGSKTALEYGSFFQAAGCQTTIVSRSPLMRTRSLHHVDEDLRVYVVDGMRKRGIEILEGAHVLEVIGNSKVTGVRLRLADGSERTITTDFVFLGTGERPHSQPFVDALGVQVDDKGFIKVDSRMRTSVAGVYAIGDLIGAPMEMFKARKCGVTAARNIMGDAYEFDFSEYPDFLHTTYEVTWVGLSEAEARQRYDDVVVIQMPPKGIRNDELALPCAEGSMLYAFTRPELTGFQKAVYDGKSRRLLGAHHVGFGAKDAFQYLDYLIRKGITVDEMGEMNELFLNPDHFIQLSRLRAGQANLADL
ncbi:NAD(P)/FAD-dependent oxidoreductase [Mycobacterium sp. SM1]|uniref:FAD-dependent oxidoreductase n=1 Tax=Mycobacterium sp. SM1 TaxID=2816243 RepID=UPI001BD0E20B|nr:NAD(P)/FAD-dependent oxidoreductase [Mycobacterium sp. SM1]MBS4728733.1 NAD(P)/FAD-dependent oxidoreductase [Mycobacterium sp. SM1]